MAQKGYLDKTQAEGERHAAFIQRVQEQLEPSLLGRAADALIGLWDSRQERLAAFHERFILPGRKEWLHKQAVERFQIAAEEFVEARSKEGYRIPSRRADELMTAEANRYGEDAVVSVRRYREKANPTSEGPKTEELVETIFITDFADGEPHFYLDTLEADGQIYYGIEGVTRQLNVASALLFERMPVGTPAP